MENVGVQEDKPWTMFFDGSSRRELAGDGIVTYSPSGVVTKMTITFSTQCTNNRAEFEAMVIVLRTLKDTGVTRVKVLSDYQWVIAQVNKEYKGNSPLALTFASIVRVLINAFEFIQISRILRDKNKEANFLAHKALPDCEGFDE
uniref:RNase H type-1 domain-containing protein n=1 Tax=Chenopodium quinoa TaxID=63459 RepID=A0A803M6F7_CHEQI